MDRRTRRIGAPDGVHVVGLFGGAIVLGVLGLAAILGPTATGSIVVDGSVGIAVATRHGPGLEGSAAAKDLLVRADAAMYAAKALGKGTFAYFDPRMPVRTWTELEAAG